MSENRKPETMPSLKRRAPSRATLALFTVALSLMALFGGFKLAALNQPYRHYTPPTVTTKATRLYGPVAIHIPSVDIHLPVEESGIVNGQWQISSNGASHLVTSGKPGQKNNVVIYGHNLYNLFGRIRNLRTGDLITVRTANGKNFGYEVAETLTVRPEQVEIALPTSSETLTLFTCDGFADSIRFVVRAKPIVTTAKK